MGTDLDVRTTRALEHWQEPVVFFANGLGDTVLAIPALRALAKLFPDRLTLICDRGVFPTLLCDLALKRVVEVPMTRNVPDWTREFPVGDVSREIAGCDLFISLAPWLSESLQTLLHDLAPPTSLGFFDAFGSTLPLDFTRHAADLMFQPVTWLDPTLRLEDFAAPLFWDERAAGIIDAARETASARHGILAVHADTGQPKMWPTERFVATLDRFLDRHRDFVVLLVGSAPQPLDTGRHADRIIPCYGLPLRLSMGLVARADLFLGVDSCLLHVADLARVPSVGLFGASNPVEYGFRFTPLGAAVTGPSMASIGIEPVLEALDAVLRPAADTRSAACIQVVNRSLPA